MANSWKNERWDSLRLLTPNWQSRLPGFGYEGDDPDGFRTMPETIDFIERYVDVISAPVQTDTTVTSVRSVDDGYLVATTQGDWQCRTVVIASGACNGRARPGSRGRVAILDRDVHADGLSQSGSTRAGGGSRRRRIGQRHPDRRRDPPFGSARDTRVGRAHPGARIKGCVKREATYFSAEN